MLISKACPSHAVLYKNVTVTQQIPVTNKKMIYLFCKYFSCVIVGYKFNEGTYLLNVSAQNYDPKFELVQILPIIKKDNKLCA